MSDKSSMELDMGSVERGVAVVSRPPYPDPDPEDPHRPQSVGTKDTHSDRSIPSSSSSGKQLHEDGGEHDADGNGGHHDGHHDPDPPTPASLAASAVVCFVIYFVFCIVFSAVVFEPLVSSSNPPFGVPQGVGINLVGIAVGSVFFAFRSGCRGVMAGPDLLPIIFVAEAGVAVMNYLENSSDHTDSHADADAHAGDYADNHATENYAAADDHHRWLAGGGPSLSTAAVAKVIPTTLVALIIGNAITGLLFYGLGKMKTTASAIGFIPSSVVAGFLTCIGYKVIKLAFLITTEYRFKLVYIHNLANNLPHANDPWLPLLLAVVHGLALYALKRMHVVPAERLILGFIAVPLALFFIIIAAVGADLDTLREDGWFLSQDGYGTPFSRTEFYQPLKEAYDGGDNIAWGVLPRLIPIFIMGSCITALDNMLKLTSSESALGVDFNYNAEMKLAGKATLTSALLVGAPAYGQTKFNIINLTVGRTSDSRIPTLGCGFLCVAVLLSGLAGPIINFVPRFLLGGLCVFAGVGFLYENLWEGRHNMTRVSFCIVWTIFLVNFIWEFFILSMLPKTLQPLLPGLLLVFVLGIVLSTFEFMFAFMHKAKPPSIREGHECCSSAVRTEKHDNQLAVMSPWFQVFTVDSFIFFGTANALYQQLKEHLAQQKLSKPRAERTKYLIFDLVDVTGIDSSAKNVFLKVHRLLKAEGIQLVWAMEDASKYTTKFKSWGLLAGTKQYQSADLALRHVEDELLRRAHDMSYKWTLDKRVKALFQQQVLANVFTISVRPDDAVLSSARLLPWSEKVNLSAGATLCDTGDDSLYMLYAGGVKLRVRGSSGSAACYREDSRPIFPGSFFNLDRVLVSMLALRGLPSTIGAVATEDSVVLRVSRANFMAMQHNDGGLANKLLITLLVENERHRPGRTRVVQHMARSLPTHLPAGTPAARLLDGADRRVELTESQVEQFTRVFDLIRASGNAGLVLGSSGGKKDGEEIHMGVFARYVSMEAACLGSALTLEQFMAMIDASGIDEDGDGVLTLGEFLAFLRRLFIADLPSKEVPGLRAAYEAAAAEVPEGHPMDEVRVKALFGKLGFDTESPQMKNVLGVIDSDGDGDVSFNEFLTGVGMMKLFYLQMRDLNCAFFKYKNQSRRDINCKGDNSAVDELDARDLEYFLKIPRDEAEEMVFLADQDDDPVQEESLRSSILGATPAALRPTPVRTIDSAEFQQLITTWT